MNIENTFGTAKNDNGKHPCVCAHACQWMGGWVDASMYVWRADVNEAQLRNK